MTLDYQRKPLAGFEAVRNLAAWMLHRELYRRSQRDLGIEHKFQPLEFGWFHRLSSHFCSQAELQEATRKFQNQTRANHLACM